MYAGKIVEQAPAHALARSMRMRYTQALLNARPRLDNPSHSRLAVIPGRPPSMLRDIAGCAFTPRCAYAQERCGRETPVLESGGEGHLFACWYPASEVAETSPRDHQPSPGAEDIDA